MPQAQPHRVAIYATPAADAPLARAAAEWLGRDPFRDAPTRAPDPAVDPFVAEPARYGFHATIKAPFRLADGRTIAEMDAALEAFAASRPIVAVGALQLQRIGAFFALVPAAPEPALAELEEATVRAFEPFRAPLGQDEIARRRPESLTARQRDHLLAFGYPHVFDEFRFHMTLTGRVPDKDLERVEALLRARFASFLGRPLRVDGLALFVEPEPGAPFRVRALHAFGRF